MRALLRIREFRLVVLLAALILGSHAMHDSFVMILWNQIGIGAGLGSVLWAQSVAAEVVVFFWLGPLLLRHVRPEAGMGLAAVAAMLRWMLTAHLTSPAAFALIEPLHGLTFALLHLSCMRVLVAVVPNTMAATAQTVYAPRVRRSLSGRDRSMAGSVPAASPPWRAWRRFHCRSSPCFGASTVRARARRSARVPNRARIALRNSALRQRPQERDDLSSNHHPTLHYWWSMIFSENRDPLFGIML